MAHDPETKRALRTRVRALRAAVSDAVRIDASAAAAHRALTLPEVAGARSVLAYAALPEELDPTPLVDALRERGARIALPRVCGPGLLSLHWVDPHEALLSGALGIDEPSAGCAWASPEEFDLVIVPGVAFDAGCARLGFGGGFYDALLPTLPRATFKLGLAFAEQLVDKVPCETHDVRLDAVVTPDAVHRSDREIPRS